ncbi:AMP-binding protein [Paenibacillus solani]|uniref:Acyl-CoA synthetase n=1 Tax=Paenibacillus solani TaxID=1705565 RepID=A0A0M1P4Z9_9BACL|nr:AMP-binding protein [Paenibacillus solani]KOR89571.1 acyl-CoA synthetase [Paenibacillus solani]
MNIVQPLLHYASKYPNRVALSHGNEGRTYSALVQRMRQIAKGLQLEGITQDKIAILSANRIEFVEVFLGAIYAGCVPVPLDPKWSSTQIYSVIQECQPRMIFTETRFVKDLVFPTAESVIITLGDQGEGSYDRWLEALSAETDMGETNKLLFIGFTSGTTGKPKGFMRTHGSWIKSFEATGTAFELDNMKHMIAPGPLVHSLSLFALMQSLTSGATFHIVHQFKASEVLELCQRFPHATLFVVPTMIEAMLQLAIPGKLKIEAIMSSGGKWTEASKQRSKEVFSGTKIFEYYGSSEASYISYLNIHDERKLNSLGKPFPGVEISIRDANGEEVPEGAAGQLYIRSEMMFLGYYGLPEETNKTIQNGWLILGDVVYMDADGYLYLAGRSKNMMVTGGLNVFPEEVESILLQLPEIHEVMVLGLPDPYWGDQITALVKWTGQQRLSIEDMKHYCRQHTASYKAPKRLITVDEFIYTSSGKIARQAMADYVKRVIL